METTGSRTLCILLRVCILSDQQINGKVFVSVVFFEKIEKNNCRQRAKGMHICRNTMAQGLESWQGVI